jgi:putative nucleotidyltransferase with HDIG domain
MLPLHLISAAGHEFESDHTVDGVLNKGLWWAERIFGMNVCSFMLIDEDGGFLRVSKSRGFLPTDAAFLRVRPGEGPQGQAFASGCSVQHGTPDGMAVFVPLLNEEGSAGIMTGVTSRSCELDQQEMQLLELFVANVASALHNARLAERALADAARLQTRASDLAILNEIGMRIATFTDLESLIVGAMELARQSLFFRSCALLLHEQDELVVRAHYGFDDKIGIGLRIPRSKCVSWSCFESGEPILIADVQHQSDKQATLAAACCEMAAPIHGPHGVVGVIVAESPRVCAFDKTSMGLFATFAHQVASALENARLHETNRRTFYQTIRALAQALEMRDSCTLGHSERVRAYSIEIAGPLEVSPRDIEIIEQAALLHDIGKIGVRDSVLLKDAKLSAEERAIIERHPVIGDNILQPVGFLREALESVLHHHEH